jgi:hypothetical protein
VGRTDAHSHENKAVLLVGSSKKFAWSQNSNNHSRFIACDVIYKVWIERYWLSYLWDQNDRLSPSLWNLMLPPNILPRKISSTYRVEKSVQNRFAHFFRACATFPRKKYKVTVHYYLVGHNKYTWSWLVTMTIIFHYVDAVLREKNRIRWPCEDW